MRGKRESEGHGPLWRYLFDPLYIPRPLFAVPFFVGAVFAAILGILMGWQGVALGLIFGLFYAGVFKARALLVRWVTRKRDQGK